MPISSVLPPGEGTRLMVRPGDLQVGDLVMLAGEPGARCWVAVTGIEESRRPGSHFAVRLDDGNVAEVNSRAKFDVFRPSDPPQHLDHHAGSGTPR